MFLQKTTDTIKDGFNKLRITALLKDSYVESWNGEKCLYCEMNIIGTKPGSLAHTWFSEPNEFIAKWNDKNFIIDTNNTIFNLTPETKKLIKLPLQEINNIISKRDKIKELFQSYYFYNPNVDKESESNIKFEENKIEENKNYYMLAKFDNNEIDPKAKIYIQDQELSSSKNIYFLSILIALPGLILLTILIFEFI